MATPSKAELSSIHTMAYGFHPHSLVYICPVMIETYMLQLVWKGQCEFQVNLGGETFRWLKGNEWGWRVEGHVRRFGASGLPEGRNGEDEMLPAYQLQAG